MIVMAYLNNYQIGSYTYNVLSNKVVKKERVNPYVTKVFWDIDYVSDDRGDYLLLKRVIGINKKLYKNAIL